MYYIYIYIYKEDLTLNNLQWLISHKTKPKLQDLSLPIRWFSVISRILVGKILSLCRDAPGVFYSHSSRQVDTNKKGYIPWAGKPETISEGQKGCDKGTRGTNDLLFIDRYILKAEKTREQNVPMTWIDNKRVEGYKATPISFTNKLYKVTRYL